MFVYSFPHGEAGRCPFSVNVFQKVHTIIISINMGHFGLCLNIVSGVIPYVFFHVCLSLFQKYDLEIRPCCDMSWEWLCDIPWCGGTGLFTHCRMGGSLGCIWLMAVLSSALGDMAVQVFCWLWELLSACCVLERNCLQIGMCLTFVSLFCLGPYCHRHFSTPPHSVLLLPIGLWYTLLRSWFVLLWCNMTLNTFFKCLWATWVYQARVYVCVNCLCVWSPF